MKTLKWSRGDIHFNFNGKTRYVEQDEKVAQDIAYYVLEALTQNRPRSRHDAILAITGAIQKMRSIQDTRSDLSPRERVSEITELTTVPNPDDPATSYYFYMVVTTEAGDSVPKIFDPEERADLSHLLPEQGV